MHFLVERVYAPAQSLELPQTTAAAAEAADKVWLLN